MLHTCTGAADASYTFSVSHSQKLLIAARILALISLANIVVLFVSGGFIVEESRGLGIHGFGGIIIHVFTGLLAVSLGLRAWLDNAGVWAAAGAVILFALTFPQAALGSEMTMALHISGSLVLTLLAAWLTAWTFMDQRTPMAT